MKQRKSKGNAGRCRFTFSLDAPQANEVYLMGDFNGWRAKTHSLKKNRDGIWQKIVMLEPGRYEYRYLVDGDWWNDPQNDQMCPNSFGTQNSVIRIKEK